MKKLTKDDWLSLGRIVLIYLVAIIIAIAGYLLLSHQVASWWQGLMNKR